MRGSSDTPAIVGRLADLSDPARLRMLRLLADHELSVGELARALQLPQSTVSRHLKLLHDGGWIMKRQEGTASLYRLLEADLPAERRELWQLTRAQLAGFPPLDEDDSRLAGVLAERRTDSRAFFGRVGGEWAELRRELFGGRFTGEALLSLVSPTWTVADLGCGTGDATEHLAPHVRRVIAVDREPAMLEAARRRVAGFDNVEFRQGSLESLPIDDAALDAALVLLVLHHLEDPDAAILEIARTLRPGGVLLVVDMVAHTREEYRHTMGHRHLGFDAAQVHEWARAAGLADVRLHDHPRAHPA